MSSKKSASDDGGPSSSKQTHEIRKPLLKFWKKVSKKAEKTVESTIPETQVISLICFVRPDDESYHSENSSSR